MLGRRVLFAVMKIRCASIINHVRTEVSLCVSYVSAEALGPGGLLVGLKRDIVGITI